MLKTEELLDKANQDNKKHPCITCPNRDVRYPDHLAFISAQYVATALYKECIKQDCDAAKILELAQATALLIKEA